MFRTISRRFAPFSVGVQFGLALFLLLGISAFAAAQPQRMGMPGPKEIRIPHEDVVVTMHRFSRLPMVELTINGEGPYRLIVDTGAAGVVVAPDVAKQLELPSPPGMPAGTQMQVRTPGGPVSATLHYIEEVAIGGAEFEGVWTIATELPFGDGMDGVIGMNVFKDCLLTYDYPQDRIVIGRGELPEPNGEDVFAYETPTMPDSHPVIEMEVDGVQTPTMIDTGMAGWFAVPENKLEEFTVLGGPAEVGRGLSVGGGVPRRGARLETDFAFGPNRVENPVVVLSHKYMLGTMFLNHFAVTFDGQRKRIRLARKEPGVLVQPEPRNLGFGLKRSGDAMEVWYVQPESHAGRLGLEIGDLVLEIDGKPAVDFHATSDLLELIQAQEEVSIRYQPKNGSAKDAMLKVFHPLQGE